MHQKILHRQRHSALEAIQINPSTPTQISKRMMQVTVAATNSMVPHKKTTAARQQLEYAETPELHAQKKTPKHTMLRIRKGSRQPL